MVIINGFWIKIYVFLLRLFYVVGCIWIVLLLYVKYLGLRFEYYVLKFFYNLNLFFGRVQNDLNYFFEYEIFGLLFLLVFIDFYYESDVELLKDYLLFVGYGDRFLFDFRSEVVFVFKVCL